MNEHARDGTPPQALDAVVAGWKPGHDQPRRAPYLTAQLQRDARPERESGDGVRQAGVALAQKRQGGAGVLGLADAFVVRAMAQVHAAIVESQHHRTGMAQSPGDAVNHLVVHRAPMLRMGMTNQRSLNGFAILWPLQQRLQLPCRPVEHQRFDAARH